MTETQVEDIIFSMDDSDFIDADYQVTTRETRKIQSEILQVIRQKAVLQKNTPTVPIGKGTKEWYVYVDLEGSPPIFDDNFLAKDEDENRKEELIFYPAYEHKNYRISMVDADQVAGSKFHRMTLPMQTIRNLTGLVSDYKEKILWRGYDIAGRANAAANPQGAIDTAVKGVLNTSGINTFHAGSGDAVITTVGDAVIGQGNAIVSLIADDFYGPYDYYITPGPYGRMIQNLNATTNLSDLQLMESAVDVNGKKFIKSLSVTKHLLPTIEASGTEANWAVIDPIDQNGNPTIMVGEAYPLSNLSDKGLEAGIAAKGMIIWAGVVGVLRPEAITWDENITYA